MEEKIAPQRTLVDMVEEQAKQDYVGIEDIKHLYPQEKTPNDEGIKDIQHIFDEHDMRLIEEGKRVKDMENY